ncbi:Retrovirus-related Pol polyprotein, partial [Mucuna pruriens]
MKNSLQVRKPYQRNVEIPESFRSNAQCTFVDAILDLGVSINPTGMTIQLVNRSIVQPVGVLEDVLVQVNELIFPADFYVLDMEDETSGKGSTLILGRPFLMIARTKIDVHPGHSRWNLFNIFEAMKHPSEDHSLFGIKLIDELVEEYLRLDNNSEDSENFARSTDLISCLRSITEEADYEEVHNLPNSKDNNDDSADLEFEAELFEVLDQACNLENPKCVNRAEVEVGETKKPFSTQLATIFTTKTESAKRGRDEEKTQSLVIIANNIHHEQEDSLLNILRQHKKAIGWKLSDLPNINPSICMHRILMKEEFKPIRKQQRRLNSTILDVVKNEVTKLLAAGIIYPISDSQWVSLVQVVPKKSGMTVIKNQQDELATHEDHFPLPFIDQVLEKLAGKSHYNFLDGFSSYMQIHIAPEDQHKTTFTCPFSTFAYSRMPFGMCNAPTTSRIYYRTAWRCLWTISRKPIQGVEECIDTNLVLNFEKLHFMLTEGIVLGHLVSNRGIEVDKSKIDIISSLPNPASVREVRSFLGHIGFYRRFIKNFSKLALPLSRLLQKDVDFNFDQPCIEAFQELKNRLTSAPILQAPN